MWESILASVAGGLAGAAGSKDARASQEVDYLPGQEEGLVNFLNAAKQSYLAGPQQYYPGQTVADLNPLTIAGQNTALGTVNAQQDIANMMGGSLASLMSGGNQVGGFQLQDQIGWGIDPALQDAVMDPIMRNLEQRVLPGLDMAATQQGAFGGTRQALMKGQAAANATEQASEALARANVQARQQSIAQRAGDISAQLQGRQQDIGQNQLMNQTMLAGMGMAPQVTQALLNPANTMMNIGQQRALYDQALLDADIARWNFGQQAPQDHIDRLGSRMSLIPTTGYSTVAYGTDGSAANILGGALGGLSLYNSFQQPQAPTSGGSQGWMTPGAWDFLGSIGAT